MYREHVDKVVVGHITDHSKTYLSWNMKPEYVRDIYESKVLPLGKNGSYVSVEKNEAKTSKEMLWELATESHASVIVVGNHGRKGPKADQTVAGTAIEFLSANATVPLLIIKDRKPRADKPEQALRYGVCYDGSDKSHNGLEQAMKMARDNDHIVVISVGEEKRTGIEALWQRVDESAAKYGAKNVEKVELHK